MSDGLDVAPWASAHRTVAPSRDHTQDDARRTDRSQGDLKVFFFPRNEAGLVGARGLRLHSNRSNQQPRKPNEPSSTTSVEKDRTSSRMAKVAPSEQEQPCMSSAVAAFKLQASCKNTSSAAKRKQHSEERERQKERRMIIDKKGH